MKIRNRSFLLACCLLLYCGLCLAQRTATYDRKGVFTEISLSMGSAAGDLADRYGRHQGFGFGASYHPSKGIEWGLRGQFLFGQQVREDVLAPYRTDLGQIIGSDGLLTNIAMRERVSVACAYAGWLWPVGRQTRYRHGILFNTGAGWMEHHIRLQDDSRSAEQFYTDFGRGLDRLTNGMCLQGFAGYELKSMNGRVNLYTGMEIIYGFTQGRREWNYDQMRSETGIRRNDILLQWKLAWYLPFFFDRHAESIEY